jgi:hypothetical protein
MMTTARWVWCAAAASVALCACPNEDPAREPFTLLQANVGNTLLACQEGYIFKLCEVSVENAIRDNIAQLRPDVIALQEVLPDEACASIDEQDRQLVCHPDHAGEGDSATTQIERLLGDAYETACDERNGYECVAVRKDGPVSRDGAYVTPPPVDSDDEETCDDGFTIGVQPLLIAGAAVTLVNGHPQSGFIGRCRRKQLEQAFAVEAPNGGTVLLSGDWNLDPFRDTDESADLWVNNVDVPFTEGKPFRYHSGPHEKNPPFPTTRNVLFTGTLDHVASSSNGAIIGGCTTLGEAPGTERLDGADGGNGCDHRALSCDLNVPQGSSP